MRVARPLRRDRQAVELARQTDGEVADVDHLLHFAQPFLQDLAGLERDERAESRLAARSSSPNRRTSSPRRGAGTDRHSLKAAAARATAAVTSVGECIGICGDPGTVDRGVHLERPGHDFRVGETQTVEQGLLIHGAPLMSGLRLAYWTATRPSTFRIGSDVGRR